MQFNGDISYFKEKYKEALSEPIIRQFLSSDENRKLFKETLTENNEEKNTV